MKIYLTLFCYLIFSLGLPFRSQGDANNFYYFYFRFYDSKIGRFISADPIVPKVTQSQSLNHYAYVYNSPLTLTDPTGNIPELAETLPSSSLSLLGEVDSSRNDFLNIRMDFDVQGNPIDRSSDPVVVDERGQVIDKSRAVQGVSYAAREALRFGLAPINEAGEVAQVMLMPENFDDYMKMAGSISKKFGRIPVTTISESKFTSDRLNRSGHLFFSDLDVRSGVIQGFKAGASQTPILNSHYVSSIDSLERRFAVRLGFLAGSHMPPLLSVGGGAFGIYSGLQSESRVVQDISLIAGGLEILGGAYYLKESYQMASILKVTSSGRTSLSSVFAARHLMKVGGVFGLIAIWAEVTYRGGGFDNPIPKYTRKEAIDMRMRAQGVVSEKQSGSAHEDPSGKYSGSVK